MTKSFKTDWDKDHLRMTFEDESAEYIATLTHRQALDLADWIKKQYFSRKQARKTRRERENHARKGADSKTTENAT